MSQEIFDLAKKLKELSERGIGGEKENAEAALNRLLKKHGITIEEIQSQEVSSFRLKVPKERRKLAMQIICNVLGKGATVYSFTKGGRRTNEIEIVCTQSEFIEISEKFSFYWAKLKEDQELFYRAFIQKNKLYTKANKDNLIGDGEQKPLTPQEKADLFKLLSMMDGLERHTHLKQIEHPHLSK